MIANRARALADGVRSRSRAMALFAAENPRRMFVAWALLTLAALPGLSLLERRTDGLALLPPESPALQEDREIRQQFGLRDQVVVFLDAAGPSGVLDREVLATIASLTRQARAIDGIGRHHVTSLDTEPRDRLQPGTGRTFPSFATPLPRNEAELEAIAADLELPSSQPLWGTVISEDRQRAAILVGAPEELGARQRLIRRLESAAAAAENQNLRLHVVGAPAASALLAEHILRDLAVLIPISLLLVALVIGRGTGSLAAVLLALGKVGLTLAFTFGLLGLLGVPIYLPVTIVPVVLAALCIADEIHILIRYRQELRRTDTPKVALERTLHAMAMPVVVATATTCIGFLSCLATGIPPIRALGLAAGIGTAYSLFFSLTLTPALLAILPARWFERRRPAEVVEGPSETTREALGPLSRWPLERPAATLALLTIPTLLALVAARQVHVQDSWIDCFAEGSDFRIATQEVNGALDGVHLLHLRVQLGEEAADRTLLEPAMLSRIAEIENVARRGRTVGDVLGPTDQLRAVAAFWRVEDWQVSEAEATHLVSRFDFAPGRVDRQRVLSDDLQSGVITVFLREANFRDTAALYSDLRAAEARLLEPAGLELGFAGDIAVSQALIPAVVRGQMASLPLALLGVFASVFLLCGSLRLALASLMPVALGALWMLGGLAALGLPLGVATSMFFVISIGLGVDSHSIHLILRAQEKWQGDDPEPIRRALAEVRPAILINSFAIAGGFGLLGFSTVPPNRNLGLLIAAAILLGCGITLTGLASILQLASKRRTAPPVAVSKPEPEATPQPAKAPSPHEGMAAASAIERAGLQIHRSLDRNRGATS